MCFSDWMIPPLFLLRFKVGLFSKKQNNQSHFWKQQDRNRGRVFMAKHLRTLSHFVIPRHRNFWYVTSCFRCMSLKRNRNRTKNINHLIITKYTFYLLLSTCVLLSQNLPSFHHHPCWHHLTSNHTAAHLTSRYTSQHLTSNCTFSRWIRWYLTSQGQEVVTSRCFSYQRSRDRCCGVPKGDVEGPPENENIFHRWEISGESDRKFDGWL